MRWLNLEKNQLTTLPSEIGNLQELSVLMISDNQLVSLPSTIGTLKALKGLDACNNPLATIPEELMNLDRKTSLMLFTGSHSSLFGKDQDLESSSETIESFDTETLFEKGNPSEEKSN